MSAHTPVPWIKDKYGHIREANGSMVLITGVGLSGTETDEVRANRDLFYAAPDLLAALKELLDREWQDDNGDETLERARYKARDAIAKAEGKA